MRRVILCLFLGVALSVPSNAWGQGNPTINRLIAGLRDKSALKRCEAAKKLAQLGAKAQVAARPLVQAVGDEDEDVREAVASALIKLHKAAVPALLEAVDSPREAIQLFVLDQLDLIDNSNDPAWTKKYAPLYATRVRPAYLRNLRQRSALLKLQAVQHLASRKDRDALPLLIGLACQEPEGELRDDVIESLGHYDFAAPTLLPVLTRLIRENKGWHFEGKHGVFKQIGGGFEIRGGGARPSALRALLCFKERALPAYLELLNCPDKMVRENVVWVIERLEEKGRPAGPALARRLMREKDEDVRGWIVSAFVRIRCTDEVVLRALHRCLSHRSQLMRAEAADALVQLGHNKGSAVLVLVDVLRRAEDSSSWCAAAYSLRGYGRIARPALPRLKEGLYESSKYASALWALVAIDPEEGPRIMPLVARLLRAGDEELVVSIAECVRDTPLPTKPMQAALVVALRRPVSPGTRLDLLDGLEKSTGEAGEAPPGVLPILRNLLKGPDEDVRAKAGDLLKRWAPKGGGGARPRTK